MLFLTLGLGIGVLVMLVVDAEVLGSGVDVAVLLAPLVVHAWGLGAAHEESKVEFFLLSNSFVFLFLPCATSQLPPPYY